MVELEVQVLALEREGLLMDIGRVLATHGFALQRQRLVQDPHGALLTVIVRGPARRQRALDQAIAAHARVVSSLVEEAANDGMRPHFAATRTHPAAAYVPPPAPEPAPATPARHAAAAVILSPLSAPGGEAASGEAAAGGPVSAADLMHAVPSSAVPTAAPAPSAMASRSEPSAAPVLPEPLCVTEPGLLLPTPPPAPAPLDPFIEITPLPPDAGAVARLLADVDALYPAQLMAAVQAMDQALPPGAREPTLRLAGKRIGAWLLLHRASSVTAGSLDAAIAAGALPVLREWLPAEARDHQLHLHDSPLCAEPGHAGCAFFAGLLEGLLAPRVASGQVDAFNVCCRAWGADACVIALAE